MITLTDNLLHAERQLKGLVGTTDIKEPSLGHVDHDHSEVSACDNTSIYFSTLV